MPNSPRRSSRTNSTASAHRLRVPSKERMGTPRLARGSRTGRASRVRPHAARCRTSPDATERVSPETETTLRVLAPSPRHRNRLDRYAGAQPRPTRTGFAHGDAAGSRAPSGRRVERGCPLCRASHSAASLASRAHSATCSGVELDPLHVSLSMTVGGFSAPKDLLCTDRAQSLPTDRQAIGTCMGRPLSTSVSQFEWLGSSTHHEGHARGSEVGSSRGLSVVVMVGPSRLRTSRAVLSGT